MGLDSSYIPSRKPTEPKKATKVKKPLSAKSKEWLDFLKYDSYLRESPVWSGVPDFTYVTHSYVSLLFRDGFMFPLNGEFYQVVEKHGGWSKVVKVEMYE